MLIWSEKQGFQPRAAPHVGEQPFSLGMPHYHSGLGMRGKVFCVSPTYMLLQPFPLLWSAGPGEVKQEEADPGYDLLQGSKQLWHFNAIKINRWTETQNLLYHRLGTYLRRFQKEAWDKEMRNSWWPKHWETRDKIQILYQNKWPSSNSQQISNSLGRNCLRNRLGTKTLSRKWFISENAY